MAEYIEIKRVLRILNELVNDCPDKEEFYNRVFEKVDAMPAANVVPKSEVERLTVELEAMRGAANSYKMHYENAKAEVAREIFEEIEKEIVAALNSNFKAKEERLAKPHIEMADEFIAYCDGKILALSGINEFIAELKKKYTEGEPNG